MGEFFTLSGVEMVSAECPRCKAVHAFERAVYNVAKQQGHNGSIKCPHGHSWHYPFGETEADKLRRERDALKQDQARLFDRLREQREAKEAADRSARAYKGQATKLRKRAKAGVCPCCNRTFDNLHRHMKTKHPHFGPDEPLKVIEGGKKSA